jgi:ParB family chromosome partitioning protein
MDVREIPLDQLHFGHEASIPINARKVGRDVEIDSLAASLLAHGLGQPLNVRELDGLVYVVDGNRRLAALYLNRDAGSIPADHHVACNFDFNGYSDELSLALNFQRVAMHPADEYEKFQELHALGIAPDQIGHRFGIEPKRVRRILALGSLSPMILDAWRNEQLGDRADEAVRAFTMAPSLEEQERVFKKLSKSSQLWSHAVHQELGLTGTRETSNQLKFVGVAAYKKAGGAIIEDLFGENHHVADPGLVKRLWDEKLAAKLAELKADGWAWVEMGSDLPYSWSYSWEKLKLNKSTATAEDKARSGCVVSIDHSGDVDFTYGVVKPVASKPANAVGKPVEKGPPTISDAVMQRLSVQLTKAAKDAIVATPAVALAAVIAGMSAYQMFGGMPVRLRAEGILKEPREQEPFEAVFARLLKLSTDELLAAVAAEACFTLDLSSHNSLAPPLGKASNSLLVESLDQEVLQDALRARFDAEDYFKTVPRSFTVAAIAEAINADEARKADKLKKGELVAFAVANVPKTGWLPVELRTASYAGPGAVKAAKPSRKKAA